VLIVDDSVGAAKILARLIRHLGPHTIEVAHDGPSAIERAETFQPEIMLLDIGLPKMDGFTVARKLRENGGLNGALLVALTGYGQEEDRRRSKEAGFDEHVVKPVAVETLRQLLSHPKLSA
jgi:CheY-like chemotaxis protein